MKLITKYIANDGTEFLEETKALSHDHLIWRINNLMKQLPSRPDTSDFTNGLLGYIQHDPVIVKNVRKELLKIIAEYIDHEWIQKTMDDFNVDTCYVARLIYDYGLRPFYVWDRFCCIDEYSREWGQPYLRWFILWYQLNGCVMLVSGAKNKA